MVTNNVSNFITDPKIYGEMVGSLIYIMSATRPDLCFVVLKLSQFMSNLTEAHLGLVKHVLRYIKGALNYGLNFSKSDTGLNVTGFCDSDWGSSSDRRSISGYCFRLNDKGPLIS